MTTQILAYADPFAFFQSTSVQIVITCVSVIFAVGAIVTVKTMISKHGGIGAAVAASLGVILVACIVGAGWGGYSILAGYLNSHGVRTVNVVPAGGGTPYGS
ncbi:hypothetical protein [Mycobacteroides chelonae]|uniref:Uncharacterized protein n=1 Tax=Mycobacteroides chelonae TaxID=1774 RepID=A0A1S1LZL9_MYCCH|nr:hypothetical protein [Mycobacteroides chelonae]OHU76088.1 hypothetical protein BKG84_24655 [Mycobacteroides chelonae]